MTDVPQFGFPQIGLAQDASSAYASSSKTSKRTIDVAPNRYVLDDKK